MYLRQAALLLLAGCAGVEPEPAADPDVGKATFTVQEHGGDFDTDGYELLIDGHRAGWMTRWQPFTVTELAVGSHEAEVRSIEPNCAARSETTARFTVASGGENRLDFVIDCVATGVLITLDSAGVDGARSYPVLVDGVVRQSIRPGVTTRVTRLEPGRREIALGSLPENCTLAEPQKKIITLATGDLEPVSFGITCVATTGVLRVHGETHGEDVDLNGYTLNIDTSTGDDLGLLDERSATLVIPAGAHLVALDGVASNCAVDESAVRHIELAGGGLTRDTVDLSFKITCQRAFRLAFTRGQRIALSDDDGAHVELASVGESPVWSPDGNVLAYVCGYAICRLGLDGTRFPSLPARGQIRGIDWSPDGSRLAYAFDCLGASQICQDGLTLVPLDGSAETRIALPPVAWDLQGVSWSPDGSRLAFGCLPLGLAEEKICTVALDGSSFARLVQDGATNPSWSPDGSRILFTQGGSELTPSVMNADGSGSRPVSVELRGWSGGWISNTTVLVLEVECDGWYGCFSRGITSVPLDGAARVRLTFGGDVSPAWRP